MVGSIANETRFESMPNNVNRRDIALAAAGLILGGSASPAEAEVSPFSYAGADRQSVLEKGAHSEGRLTFYSSLIPNLGLKAITDGFRKKYPFIAVETWRGTEIDIAQKTLAEMRAGPPMGDLLEGSELAPLFMRSGLLQPFASPAANDTPAEYRDKTGMTAATRFSYYGTAYNTRLVPPGTQPMQFADLLQPKWKNRMAWRVGSDSGAHMFVTNIVLSMGDAKGEAFLRALAAQNVIGFSGSAQALIDRVIAGEYSITLTTAEHLPIIAAGKGAPITAQPLQPVPATVASIMLPKRARHPHAAMLFIDYMLSPEGQTVLRDAQYFPVNAKVQPLKTLQPVSPRYAGLKENFITDTVLRDTHAKVDALLKKYFS
jgi:iron(III) transport system substrate-binding protein